MGHAGDHLRRQGRIAEDKIAAMEAAGVRVSPPPARLGKTLADMLNGKYPGATRAGWFGVFVR